MSGTGVACFHVCSRSCLYCQARKGTFQAGWSSLFSIQCRTACGRTVRQPLAICTSSVHSYVKSIRKLQALGRSPEPLWTCWESDSGVQSLPTDFSDLVSWCTPAVESTQLPVQGYWKFFPGVKRAWREIYSPSSAEVTKEWRCTSIPSAFFHTRAGTASTVFMHGLNANMCVCVCVCSDDVLHCPAYIVGYKHKGIG